jgi:hypothetical protein
LCNQQSEDKKEVTMPILPITLDTTKCFVIVTSKIGDQQDTEIPSEVYTNQADAEAECLKQNAAPRVFAGMRAPDWRVETLYDTIQRIRDNTEWDVKMQCEHGTSYRR